MKNNYYEYFRSAKIGLIFFVSMLLMPFSISAQNVHLDITAGNSQATLTWDENRTVDSVVVTGIRTLTNVQTSPFTVEGLENGKLYTFEIYFQSTEWPIVDVGVLYAIPGEAIAPRNLTSTAGNNNVTLSWQPPVDGKDYTYKLITETGENRTVGSNLTSYTVSNLVNGQPYSFRIVAIQTFTDFPGKEKESWHKATIAGATPFITATPEAVQSAAIIKALAGSIEVTAPEASELKVFTIGGQPYLTRYVPQGSSIVTVPKGMYFVTLGNTTTQKISVH